MIFYNIGIQVFKLGISLASLFNAKAKKMLVGRKNWQQIIQQQIFEKKIVNPIWIHCASLGEFEQGRPVIEAIKNKFPNQSIVLTFFSPSGYEIQQNYVFTDAVLYLPFDTERNAKQFLDIIKPSMAVFVKYEFWLNFLFELYKKNIPCYLISTVIKKHQSFFKWYGADFRKALNTYTQIYTQDKASIDLLKQLNINKGKIAGDTRFDRVLEICSSPKKFPIIEKFVKDSFVIVAGSSWKEDEDILVSSFIELKKKHSHLKLIIAPHEIDKPNIERLKKLVKEKNLFYQLFTEVEEENNCQILIINTMGMLSSMYQYGNMAFIGGGFANGIHNILEPMVYGLPVFFGPNYQKYNEAIEAINLKAAFEINSIDTLNSQLDLLISNANELDQMSNKAKKYVIDHAGATHMIVNDLFIHK